MNNIGIVADYNARVFHYKWYKFYKRFFPDCIINDEYNTKFIISYNNQNINRIFRKNQVEKAIICDDINEYPLNTIKIYDGDKYFSNHLPLFIRKTVKKYGLTEKTKVAIIDNSNDKQTELLITELIHYFNDINLYTTKQIDETKYLCDLFLNNFGVSINVFNDKKLAKCDFAIELAKSDMIYKNSTIVLSKTKNVSIDSSLQKWLNKNLKQLKICNMAVAEALEKEYYQD